ncbi:barstar family protein [Salininema proteolyticum]|uniref:Barstar family protein n=1 Tax=Salininema proteolyticum TaxID=1607685 RepID=A0ABV8U3E6_9ACTN
MHSFLSLNGNIWKDPRPGIFVEDAHGSIPLHAVFPPKSECLLVSLEGTEMVDEDAVFDVFFRRLHFPQYFGWNWDAMRDCLGDLSWIGQERILIAINDWDHVMSKQPEKFGLLVKLLATTVHRHFAPFPIREDSKPWMRIVAWPAGSPIRP